MYRNITFIIITVVFACIGVVGAAMKIMHWPHGPLLFYTGFIGMVLAPALLWVLRLRDEKK